MNNTITSWYVFSEVGSTVMRVAACHAAIDLQIPQIDHHPRTCPRCKVACAFLNWKGRVLQIVPANAPAVIQHALNFAQQQFDELEYAEFVSALQELMDDLYAASLTHAAPDLTA